MKKSKDVTSGKRDRFETELAPEEKELLQAWAAAPAPGEDKLKGLSVSLDRGISRPSRSRRGRAFAQHFATGTLLFLVGYLVGQRHDQMTIKRSQDGIVASVDLSKPIEPAAAATPTTAIEPSADRTPNDAPALDRAEPAVASAPDCKPPQVYQGKDGFFRIDTVLCQTGSQATWVINPRLEIANVNSQSSEEDFQ